MTASTQMVLLIVVVTVVLLARLVIARRRNDNYEAVRERMPAELRTAELVWSEPNDLTAWWPLAITGKPDQVFCLADGRLVVMEAKLRPQPLDPIKAQMTTYAWLLRYANSNVKGTPVAPYGWVRFGDVLDAEYRKVDLFTDAEFTALVREIEASNQGQTLPPPTDRLIYCQKVCSHYRTAEEPDRDRNPYPLHSGPIRWVLLAGQLREDPARSRLGGDLDPRSGGRPT